MMRNKKFTFTFRHHGNYVQRFPDLEISIVRGFLDCYGNFHCHNSDWSGGDWDDLGFLVNFFLESRKKRWTLIKIKEWIKINAKRQAHMMRSARDNWARGWTRIVCLDLTTSSGTTDSSFISTFKVQLRLLTRHVLDRDARGVLCFSIVYRSSSWIFRVADDVREILIVLIARDDCSSSPRCLGVCLEVKW